MKSLITSALIFSISWSAGLCLAAPPSPMDPKWTGEAPMAPSGGAATLPMLPPLPGDSAKGVGAMALVPPSSEPKLGGVFFSENARPFAVLDGQLVGLGDRHGVWTLASVTNIRVTLKSDAREIGLSLFSGNAPAGGLQIIDFSKSPERVSAVKSTKSFKKQKPIAIESAR